MLKIAVFVSGRGTNLGAILEAIKQKKILAEVKFVVSNKKECAALNSAEENGIKTYCIGNVSKSDYHSYEDISNIFKNEEIDLIVLAGFLKKIPDDFIDSFENKIINIHPALLPSFGGKGMYGMNVHKAVFESGAKVSGVTVHFVDKVYDNGMIISQKCVDISDVASPEEIAERVLQQEHKLLPYVVGKFSENKIKKIDNRIIVED